MIDGIIRGQVAAKQNWATAVQTYRSALAAYRRLLEMRADRIPWRRPLAIDPLPARSEYLVAHTPRLDGDSLTPREREVAELIARGYSNQEIAETLVLTRGTVANHVAHILAKVGAANRTQVAAWVFDQIAPAIEDSALDEGHSGVSTARLPVLRRPAFVSSTPAERAPLGASVMHIRPSEAVDQHRSLG